MKSYCRTKENEYILIGRLLDNTTLQVIQDTKIIEKKIDKTNLSGDVVCIFTKTDTEEKNVSVYPILDNPIIVNLEGLDSHLLIANDASILDARTDSSGKITLKFKDYWIELTKYRPDFYQIFLISSIQRNIERNINIYQAKQII